MARWINSIILIAILASSWTYPQSEELVDFTADFFWFVALILLMFGILPIFSGLIFGLFAHGRMLSRPSLDKFPFTRNTPLQFLWFGGMIFCAGGIGQLVGSIHHGVSTDGLIILAAGIGVLLGSAAVVRIFPRRFAKAAHSHFAKPPRA